MFCRKCGAEMPDLALVCGKCGTPVKPYQDSASRRAEEKTRAFGKPEEPEAGEGTESAAAPEMGESRENAAAPEIDGSAANTAAPEMGEGTESAAAPEMDENKEPAEAPKADEGTENTAAPDEGGTAGNPAAGEDSAENTYSREIQRIREESRVRQQTDSPEEEKDKARGDRMSSPYRRADTGSANRAAGGRIPYGATPAYDPETERAVRSKYSSLALTLGIISVVALLFPYVAIPLSVMAVLFGAIGLRQGEYARQRGIVGIVLGVIALGTAIVLVISMAMMAPYTEDVMRIFQEYMRSRQ